MMPLTNGQLTPQFEITPFIFFNNSYDTITCVHTFGLTDRNKDMRARFTIETLVELNKSTLNLPQNLTKTLEKKENPWYATRSVDCGLGVGGC